MDIQKVINCYLNENMSTYEIAKKFKTYPNKIRRELIKNGIEIRDHSEAQSKALETGVAKHPTKGKKVKQETKDKIGESMLNNWKNMPSKERRYESALALRRASIEGSRLEKYLMNGLMGMGYSVSMHYLFAEKQHIDLFISLSTKNLKGIAIEVDGPTHFKPIWGKDSLAKRQKSDNKKTGLLLSNGFALIRVITKGDDSDIRMKKTLTKIDQTIQSLKNSKENYFEIYTEEF
jgi:very-short-patch-repair endonuclease